VNDERSALVTRKRKDTPVYRERPDRVQTSQARYHGGTDDTGTVVRQIFDQAQAPRLATGRQFVVGSITRERGAHDDGGPILREFRSDYATVVLVLRWVEFLLERVKREKLARLLDYYVDIGWISPKVKSHVMVYARGEVQEATAYGPSGFDMEPDDAMVALELENGSEPPAGDYGDYDLPEESGRQARDDWKLTAEDHLKSLTFIQRMAGHRIDRNSLNSLEQEIRVIKYSLKKYHEI